MPKKRTITNAQPLHRSRRSMKAKKVFDPSDNYLPKKINKHSKSESIKSNNVKKNECNKKNNQETESKNSLVNYSSDCTPDENNDTLIRSPVPSSSSTHTEMPDAKTIPCALCCKIADVQDVFYCCICSAKVHQDCLFMDEPMWKFKLDSSSWICESCRESHCSQCFKNDKEKLLSCITCEVGVHPHCYDSCIIKPFKMIKDIDVVVCIPCLTLATRTLSEEEDEEELREEEQEEQLREEEDEEEEYEEEEYEEEEEEEDQGGNDREMEEIEDSGERVEEDENEIMEEESEDEIDDDCKRRWKNIRKTYISYMLQKKKCSTESTTISNIEEVVRDTDNDSSVEQELTTTQDLPSTSYGGKRIRSNKDKLSVVLAKRAKDQNELLPQIQTQNEVLTKNMQGIDDIDLFFKSIALTVKKLPSQTIRDAKINILSYVSQLENQNLAKPRPFDNNQSELNIS